MNCGCLVKPTDPESTTASLLRGVLYLVGPNTYYPLNAFSKKQTSITVSRV